MYFVRYGGVVSLVSMEYFALKNYLNPSSSNEQKVAGRSTARAWQ